MPLYPFGATSAAGGVSYSRTVQSRTCDWLTQLVTTRPSHPSHKLPRLQVKYNIQAGASRKTTLLYRHSRSWYLVRLVAFGDANGQQSLFGVGVILKQTDFADMDSDWFETVEKGHGRVETRRCTTVSSQEFIAYLNERERWSNLSSVAMVESERDIYGKVSSQTRYYISSLSRDAERMLKAVRGHWEVENLVHWVLDVSFGEDASRVRKGNGAENLAALRRMALNLLKRENTLRVGIAAKRKRAGWDTQYLLKLLAQ